MPNYNGVWSLTTQYQYAADWPVFRQSRALFMGGNQGGTIQNVIEFVDITTAGDGTDFGDLTVARSDLMAVSSDTRAVAAGKEAQQSAAIDYVTIASAGNAADFGDQTAASSNGSGTGNAIRGLFALGLVGDSNVNSIDYITIATTGNATDFGDRTTTAAYMQDSGVSSTTRGIFAGGYISSAVDIIDYVTIANTGNATDFGNLTSAKYGWAGASSSIRGCFAGGTPAASNIDYITIATTGNASDFGDLTAADRYAGGTSMVLEEYLVEVEVQ